MRASLSIRWSIGAALVAIAVTTEPLRIARVAVAQAAGWTIETVQSLGPLDGCSNWGVELLGFGYDGLGQPALAWLRWSGCGAPTPPNWGRRDAGAWSFHTIDSPWPVRVMSSRSFAVGPDGRPWIAFVSNGAYEYKWLYVADLALHPNGPAYNQMGETGFFTGAQFWCNSGVAALAVGPSLKPTALAAACGVATILDGYRLYNWTYPTLSYDVGPQGQQHVVLGGSREAFYRGGPAKDSLGPGARLASSPWYDLPSSIAVDAANRPHVAVAGVPTCASSYALQYSTSQDGVNFTHSFIDPISSWGPSAELSSDGALHVAYWHDYQLRYASKNANGTWSSIPILALPGSGHASGHLAFNPITGQPGISYFDRAAMELRIASRQAGPVTNAPPVVAAVADQTVTAGRPMSVPVIGSDPEGGPLTYRATLAGTNCSNTGIDIDPATGLISGTPPLTMVANSPYQLVVTAADPEGNETVVTFRWTVLPNQPPAIVDPGPQVSDENTSPVLAIEATDPEGDVLSFSATGLPLGLSIDPATGVISGTVSYEAARSYEVTVSANDGQANVTTIAFSWAITDVNRPPAVTTLGNLFNDEGTSPRIPITAIDPDGDSVSFTASGLPSGMSIDRATGVISGMIAAGAAGVYPVVVTGTDSRAGATDTSFTWTVTTRPTQWVFEDATPAAPDPACGSWWISPAGFGYDFAGRPVFGWMRGNSCGGDSPPYWSGLAGGVWQTFEMKTDRFQAARGNLIVAPDGSPWLSYAARIAGPWDYYPRVDGTYTANLTTHGEGNHLGELGDGGYEWPHTYWTLGYTGMIMQWAPIANRPFVLTRPGFSGGNYLLLDRSRDPNCHWCALQIANGVGRIAYAVGPQDQHHIVYTRGQRAIYRTGSSNDAIGPEIDIALTGSSYREPEVSAAADANNRVHLAIAGIPNCANPSSGGLIYMTSSDNGATWTRRWVDATGGTAPHLALDRDGAPHIAYWLDGVRLRYASPGPDGQWSTVPVFTGVIGTNPAASLTFDPAGTPAIAFFNRDAGRFQIARGGPANGAPTVTMPEPLHTAVGAAVSAPIAASDPESEALTFGGTQWGLGTTSCPATGVSWNAAGVFAGTVASAASAGTPYEVIASVSDTFGNTTTATFPWTINQPPTMVNPGDQQSDEGASVSLQITASDPDGEAVVFGQSGLPTGLTIDPVSGLISGTIAADGGGAHSVTITATDSAATVASVSFVWTVRDTSFDLAVTGIATLPAGRIVYDYTITNRGAESATNAVSTTTLPWTATFVSASEGCTAAAGQVVCDLGTLAGGASTRRVIEVLAPARGTVTTRTTVSATEADPDPSNNSVTLENVISCATPPPDLTVWWRGQNTAADEFGANNGTFSGGAQFTEGVAGNAFLFDSDDDRVSVASSSTLDVGPTGFTAAFWMRGIKNQPQSLFAVVEKSHGFIDNTGWAFQGTTATGSLGFVIGAGGGPPYTNFPGVATSVDVLDGEFHHIAGTWDGSTIRLYVDGVLQGSYPLSVPINNARPLNVGFAYGGASPQRFFRGLLDEVQIFSRALTGEEVARLADASTGGACANNPPSLSVTNQASDEGEAVSVQITANDPDGDNLTYAASGLPDGLAIDVTSGLITGATSYTSAGDYPVTIDVADTFGAKASGSFTWTITESDTTPPVVVGVVSPAPNALGWSNQATTVNWTVDDPESGIASSIGCDPSAVTDETAGSTITCTAVNGNGMTATESVTVRLDRTPPTIVMTSREPPPNDAGWNNTFVTLRFECDDALAGLSYCTTLRTAAEQGRQTVTGKAHDAAGNIMTVDVVVNIDTVAPSLTVPSSITTSSTYPPGTTVDYTVSAEDSRDGPLVAQCSPASGSLFPIGTTTVTCTATDSADNRTTKTFTVTVPEWRHSTTTVTPSVNPSVNGQPVTLTAVVAATGPPAGVPTGTVTFVAVAAGAILGTASLDGAGAASLTLPLPAGSHEIRADYGGDATFLASTATATQVVDRGRTTIVLSSSQSPSTSGEAVTLTATVAAVLPAVGMPSGPVVFFRLWGNTEITLGTAATDGSGVATMTTTALPEGTYRVGAAYDGDGAFVGSTTTLEQVVVPQPWTAIRNGDPESRPAFNGVGRIVSAPGKIACTATLVSRHVVLTAAQCLRDQAPDAMYEFSLGDGRTARVTELVPHPLFRYQGRMNLAFDVALARLDETAADAWTDLAPSTWHGSAIELSQNGVAVGFSRIESGIESRTSGLLDPTQSVSGRDPFGKLISGAFIEVEPATEKNQMFCAPGTGGPLFVADRIAGVASFRYVAQCEQQGAGYYVSVSHVSDWMRDNIGFWELEITSPGDRTNDEGTYQEFAIVAGDPNGRPLTYRATGLPPDIEINPDTGVISGTLSYTSAGTHDVLVVVSSTTGEKSARFTWTVNNVKRPPVAGAQNVTTAEDTSLDITFTATDPDAEDTALTFEWTGPDHGTLVPIEGASPPVYRYTPATNYNGADRILVRASDGQLYSQWVEVTIAVTPVNDAPTVTSPGDQVSAAGSLVSLAVVAADPDGDALSFSATGLPPDLAIDGGTGVIAGRLSYSSLGTRTVTITVRDAIDGGTSATFEWVVTRPLWPPTLAVTTTADVDDGWCNAHCSLREALLLANRYPGATIAFAIPRSDAGFARGVFTIQPTAPLPAITETSVLVDGTTQTAFAGDTNPAGPEIVLNGSRAPAGTAGLTAARNRIVIRGLTINNFPGPGVFIDGTLFTVQRPRIEGNYIGTNEDGTTAAPNAAGVHVKGWVEDAVIGTTEGGTGNVISGNAGNGITLESMNEWWGQRNVARPRIDGNLIGTNASGTSALGNTNDGIWSSAVYIQIGSGTDATRNVISANGGSGIVLRSGNSPVVIGNYIGTDITGTQPLGNGGHGVSIGWAHRAEIGGIAARRANHIAFNARAGVRLEAINPHAIRGNAIFGNAGLGIDVDPEGVTANDPGDADDWRQNFPILTSALSAGGLTTIVGTLDTTPGSVSSLDFYANGACDAAGHGEGERWLGTIDVSIQEGEDSVSTFTATLNVDLAAGMAVTATATRAGSFSDTSEFSPCVLVVTDTTPPVITAAISPAPNAGGWHRSPVHVTWSVDDPESSIASSTGCEAVDVAEDTSAIALTCRATNAAGLSATESIEVRLDQTPPAVSCPASPTVPADANGKGSVPDLLAGLAASDNLTPSAALMTNQTPPAETMLEAGEHTISIAVTDDAGNMTACSTTLAIVDVTAPVVFVPDDIAVDATSPAGAPVYFAARAIDNVDGPVAVACAPASNSTFPIGPSTVTCSAQDAAGNRAANSFSIHVRGATEQVTAVLGDVVRSGVGPGASLASKLENALAAIGAGNPNAACGELQAFQNQVRAQTGKSLYPEFAAQLMAAAARARATLGCQ